MRSMVEGAQAAMKILRCRRSVDSSAPPTILRASRYGWSPLPAIAGRDELQSMNHNCRRPHAFALDQIVKSGGVIGIEPHAAVRGRPTEARDLVGAMNGVTAIKKDRMRHRRIVIAL